MICRGAARLRHVLPLPVSRPEHNVLDADDGVHEFGEEDALVGLVAVGDAGVDDVGQLVGLEELGQLVEVKLLFEELIARFK